MRMRLEMQPNLTVIGEAGSTEEALDWLAWRNPQSVPELVLTDVAMRGASGIVLVNALHERYPEIAVLVVSMHDNLEYVRQAVHGGARGYVLKDAPADELIAAIDAVLAGRLCYSSSIARRLVSDTQRQPVEALTRRELDILERIGQGMANRMIASELGLSVRTVETHRLNLKRKLGIDGQAELVKYAVEHTTGAASDA
ncbi:hypothetical protein DFQ28_008669 [Apophysomyces sp. BC1034]|nr:hypothetical protein DFQ28_008669 [Apophysomyces sp. BC1034]